jgi:hypothetical protein
MATIATHVKTYLLLDGPVASIVANRVYDTDVRIAGPNATVPTYRTANGFTLSHIIVDDTGGLAAPFGPSGSFIDRLAVYIITPATTTGRAEMETLRNRLMVKLHRWQEANTKALLSYADRTGYQMDPPPMNAGMDVLTFSVAGIAIGVPQ